MPRDNFLSFERALTQKRIFVTGHTGFTGGWACLWLNSIGAKVAGFGLMPESTPSLFQASRIEQHVDSFIGDIRDLARLEEALNRFGADMVLHLAAQPLVRRSYREPVPTFEVNTLGTANVLEAARTAGTVKSVLVITTDKVYENREWDWSYRENDRLGGKDPYSASKSAAEMVVRSYTNSYPFSEGKGPAVAVARGGNIIGGGDWSEDRLVPDFVRAVVDSGELTLRYPNAIRPWQHVLALVHGYLLLLAGLCSAEPLRYARAWNLGPLDQAPFSVRDMLELLASHWERPKLRYMENPLPEAHTLALDSGLARNSLGWLPPWSTEEAVKKTALWYQNYYASPLTAEQYTLSQIEEWRSALL